MRGLFAFPETLFFRGCWPTSRRFFVFVNFFHANIRKKGLQRQQGVVKIVSSLKRRALAVLLMNRLSAADEAIISRGFHSFVGSGHALHEKGLLGQNDDGLLISTQKESAFRFVDKPRINRWWTASFVSSSVYMMCLFVLLGRRSSDVSSISWRVRERLVS